jgi:uncharacterized protein YjcR
MTELEQKLLDELEQLEKERSQEAERLKRLAEEYERSIENVSNSLTAEYQEQFQELIQYDSNSNDKLISYLKTLTRQNEQIISLLQQPPQSDNLEEKLNRVLKPLFEKLVREYQASNESLITELNESLKSLGEDY